MYTFLLCLKGEDSMKRGGQNTNNFTVRRIGQINNSQLYILHYFVLYSNVYTVPTPQYISTMQISFNGNQPHQTMSLEKLEIGKVCTFLNDDKLWVHLHAYSSCKLFSNTLEREKKKYLLRVKNYVNQVLEVQISVQNVITADIQLGLKS